MGRVFLKEKIQKCTYSKWYLGGVGTKYFIDNINFGYELDAQIARQINFTEGTVYTYAQHDSSFEDVKDLNGGRHLVSNKSLYCLVDDIYYYLSSNKNGLCLMLDAGSSRKDSWLQPYLDMMTTFNKEVYFYTASKTFSKDSIYLALRCARCPNYFITVLTQCTDDFFNDLKKMTLTKNHFIFFAVKTQYLIMNAYDAVGFVVWSRNPVENLIQGVT